MASPVRIVLFGLVLLVFGLGVYDVITNYESNGCEMTYMFVQPEYLVSIAQYYLIITKYARKLKTADSECPNSRIIAQNRRFTADASNVQVLACIDRATQLINWHIY